MKQMKEEKIDPGSGKIIHTEDGSEDHSKSGGQLAVAVNITKRDDLGERVRAAILSEQLRIAAAHEGMETFEEADDFDVGDDYDPKSPYEEVFDPGPPAPVPPKAEELERLTKELEEYKKKYGELAPEETPTPATSEK